jgi:2-polyprenyl-6-hydroxyphenyl methylase/3-demethylubiquinone-9 3-methyltransferase
MSNVDAAEVAKFEALASKWWDPESEFRPLHQINPLRANWIDARAQVAGKKLLDVGCGGGILTESMAHRGATAKGVDMGEKPLKVAQLHALETGLQHVSYEKITIEDLAEREPESFDVVCCMEMLEHVPDPSAVVAACARLAKPGGHLFFSTLNRNPMSYIQAVIGAEYVLKLLPKGTHDYRKFIRPSELQSWIRQSGLVRQDSIGLTYNPLNQRYRLTDNQTVNYMLYATKPALSHDL